MTRLVHNDYLQQASDSGLPGAALFLAWFWGGLALAYRACSRSRDGATWLTWLGLFGWALHEAVEFGLFIPGLAWPAMILLGWLVAEPHSNRQADASSLASGHP